MDDLKDRFTHYIQKYAPHIPLKDLQDFAAKSQLVEFRRGTLFLEEGQICRHLLFIHQGLFRHYLLHNGREITKDFSLQVDHPFCTDYISFMQQRPSEIWIEALEDSQVWSWEVSFVRPLFKTHPFWLHFSKTMADLLICRKERKEIDFLKCSAQERYLRFCQDFPGLSDRIPIRHIASYLGIGQESLTSDCSLMTMTSTGAPGA
jgi:CRP-like cAMP-binding protein